MRARELTVKYPQILDNFQIAEYIEANSPEFVDTERIADEYIGCHASLQMVPISQLTPGDPNHNIESRRNQKNTIIWMPLKCHP